MGKPADACGGDFRKTGEESWAPWGMAVGGPDEHLRLEELLIVKTKLLSCL